MPLWELFVHLFTRKLPKVGSLIYSLCGGDQTNQCTSDVGGEVVSFTLNFEQFQSQSLTRVQSDSDSESDAYHHIRTESERLMSFTVASLL